MATTEQSPVGKTKDVGWEIGVSKKVPYPVEQVWDLLVSDEGAALWLGPGARVPESTGETWTGEVAAGRLRGRRPNERVRTTCTRATGGPETTVQFTVSPAPGGGTTLRFHQERLSGPEEREQRRDDGRGVIERVEAALAQ